MFQVKGTLFTVKGLKSDVGYEFRVTAENKAGAGPPSAPSNHIKYEEEIQFLRDLSDIKVRAALCSALISGQQKVEEML